MYILCICKLNLWKDLDIVYVMLSLILLCIYVYIYNMFCSILYESLIKLSLLYK